MVDCFTTAFAKANPPPDKGSVPVKTTDILTESNRWPCVGGPFDGEGIAKIIALKKGAGKKKLTIKFEPNDPIVIKSEDGSTSGYYAFKEDKFIWIGDNLGLEPEVPIDTWNPDYWNRDKDRVREIEQD